MVFPWKERHVQQSKRLPVVSDHDQGLTRIAWDHRVIGGIDDDRRHPWDPCGLVSEDKSVASHAVPESVAVVVIGTWVVLEGVVSSEYHLFMAQAIAWATSLVDEPIEEQSGTLPALAPIALTFKCFRESG